MDTIIHPDTGDITACDAVAVLGIGGIGSRLGRQLWQGATEHDDQSAVTRQSVTFC